MITRREFGSVIAGSRAFATPVAAGLLLLLFVLTLGVSWLAFRLVEKPAMRFAARRRNPARGSATVTEIRSRE